MAWPRDVSFEIRGRSTTVDGELLLLFTFVSADESTLMSSRLMPLDGNNLAQLHNLKLNRIA